MEPNEMLPAISTSTFIVSVDYMRPIEEKIAAGKYNWVHPDIVNGRYPIIGFGVQKGSIATFHFGRWIQSDEVINKMARTGCRPATIEVLLAFGESYPDIQKEFPIVALGSVAEYESNYDIVPFLGKNLRGRIIGQAAFKTKWEPACRFLAIRK